MPAAKIDERECASNAGPIDIAFRPAIPTDYPYYLEIFPELEVDYSPSGETVWNTRDLPNVTIITQNGESVGYVWVQRFDDIYSISYLVVGREHRRKGILTQTLKHLKAHAKQLGYKNWGLDCDVRHPDHLKAYTSVGMRKVGEMYFLKAPYDPTLNIETDMSIKVVNDSEQWPILEDKYGLKRGRIRLRVPGGILPVLLLDAKGQVRGYAAFSTLIFRLFNLVVESPEDLMTFLFLLRNLLVANAKPEWMRFSIDTGKKYADLVLTTVPGAIKGDQYDCLEGSTSD